METKDDTGHRYGAEDAVRDGLGFLGLCLIGAGLWMRSPETALIVVGSLLLALPVFGLVMNSLTALIAVWRRA